MAEHAEEAILYIRGQLFLASLDTLQEIISEHNITQDEVKTRTEAVTLIQKWFDAELESSDKGVIAIMALEEVFGNKIGDKTSVPKESSTSVSKESGASVENLMNSNTDDKVKSYQVRYHKEFKISGQIDLKSGIPYTSLVRQVETGLSKGYREVEILDGIIRAIPQSSDLRNYLEGRRDLTLPRVRQILRNHYQEKTATELYNELGSITQGSKEGPCEFLMRAMDIRNKITFASGENGTELNYSGELVNGLFKRTVDTGLHDLAIRQEFRPLLQTGSADEQLLEGLTQIVSRENERKSKLVRTSNKRAELNAASQIDVVDNKSAKSKVKESVLPKENGLVSEVKALRAELAEMRELIRSKPANTLDSEPPYGLRQRIPRPRAFRSRACHECQRRNERICYHCWKCGGDDHIMRHCQVPDDKKQGNISGPPQRDM